MNVLEFLNTLSLFYWPKLVSEGRSPQPDEHSEEQGKVSRYAYRLLILSNASSTSLQADM